MNDKGYTKIKNIILTNKEIIINILKDFEDLEIENISNYFNYKICIIYHNNFWSILCNDVTINIIEKIFIIYNIWESFKNNVIIRVDPNISNNIIKESNIFIKKKSLKVNLYQIFKNSTILFVTGNVKNDVLDVIDFITCKLDNYDVNMHFIFVDFIYFINTLRYIIPMNINIERELKIKKTNFNNSLIFNEDLNKKRICIIGLSNNFNVIWYYIKKIIFKDKIENLKNIEYLDIEINDIKKNTIINKEKIKLISRKITKDNIQIPQYRNKIPNTVYSTSF
jgi:hypothetical protein